LTQSVTLTSGEFNSTLDAGLVLQKASLGDFVWEDKNANGIQEAGEAGIAGVTVQLKNSGGTVIQTTSTDANGKYLFDVTPGTYSVGVVAPNGFVVSPKDQGGNDAVDSDIDPTTLMTANTTIAAGQQNLTLDAGLFRKASLGDFVWNDCDSDGIQDANETGVAGVTVKLLDAAGNVAATATTDSNGKYLFNNLTPGAYSAQFVAPVGATFTLKDQGGNDALDSDVEPATGKTIQTVLESGENDLSWDAGLKFAKICADFNFNGNTALSGTFGNIRNFTSNGISVNTSAFSRDRTTGSWATGYLGSYGGGLGVTDSSEGTGANNTHTVDNTGGRDNYVLFEFNTSVVLDKAFLGYVVGDSDLQVWIGNFNNPFSNHLNLNDSVLTSMGFTELNQTTLTTTRTADLNAGDFAGNTVVIAADTTDTTPEDFFKIQTLSVCTTACPPDNTAKASLGDRVWEDKNANGIQDAGENGIAGVTVKLLNNQGQEVTSTVTNTNGNYNFTNLNPGDYQVQFVPPTGYTFSSQDQGSNDNLDSDANTSTGKTITTNLVAGENDTSWDAGLYRKACLGDFVWNDANKNGIQDAGEAGISGVTVKLLDINGTQVTTTTTNANGGYNFSNLNPGTYSVQFVAPTNYSFSPANQGTDDAKDSDANVTNGTTQQVTLTSGEFNSTLDGGIYKVNVPCVPINLCFSGNTPLDGWDGNVYTFSKNGLSVKASAFSRDKSNGNWSQAYLGAYGEGLGVTDSSEGNGGNGSHRVDNIGRNNYILFEFSAPVSVDAAYLNSVVQDSDITAWVGNFNNPFNNHLNLNDGILNGMTREENDTTSSYSRTADINASGMVGNTLVIAASVLDTTPEDQFKINNLGVFACSSDLYPC
jgi:serine-aspartate repeat-containing protein C/D/E